MKIGLQSSFGSPSPTAHVLRSSQSVSSSSLSQAFARTFTEKVRSWQRQMTLQRMLRLLRTRTRSSGAKTQLPTLFGVRHIVLNVAGTSCPIIKGHRSRFHSNTFQLAARGEAAGLVGILDSDVRTLSPPQKRVSIRRLLLRMLRRPPGTLFAHAAKVARRKSESNLLFSKFFAKDYDPLLLYVLEESTKSRVRIIRRTMIGI
jgi:hypothetical protein